MGRRMGISKSVMTPQEIFEYKQSWKLNAARVRIHSDLADRAKTWCKRNLPRSEWSMDTWTDVYEHTFYFHHNDPAREFNEEFCDYVNELQQRSYVNEAS